MLLRLNLIKRKTVNIESEMIQALENNLSVPQLYFFEIMKVAFRRNEVSADTLKDIFIRSETNRVPRNSSGFKFCYLFIQIIGKKSHGVIEEQKSGIS